MCSLLINSVNAAPKAIISSAGEFSQDIRFAFLSSNFASNFYNLFNFSFLRSNNSPSQTTISSIQVFPGSVTIKQGEKVTFSAIALDTDNEPISCLSLDWEAKDVGRNLPSLNLKNSTFQAKVIGTFSISAKHNGQNAQATITVLPSAEGSPLQPSLSALPSTIISSRTIEKEAKDSKNSENAKDPIRHFIENSQNSLPEEGNWNNSNWNSSDDPGNQTGNPTGSPADDGAGNGNFQLSAPVVSLPGRGIDLALNLNYNSRLWNKSLTQANSTELTYDIDRGSPAPGWSLGFGKMMDMGADGGSMLVDADGTRHGYTGSITNGYGGWSSFKGFTADSKFIDYTSSRDSTGIYSAAVQFPNGTYINYGSRGDGAVYPTLITDAQGNQITITYRNNVGPKINTITDTIGRVITFHYDTSERLSYVNAPKSQDEDPIYGSAKRRTLVRLHYKPHTLNYSFASGVSPIVRQQTFDVIDSIYYPATNTGYWFGGSDANGSDYEGYYSSYGMLTKVVEQRGMTYTSGAIVGGQMTKQALYNYPLTTQNETGRTIGIGLSDAPTYTKLTESWDGMDVVDPAITSYLFDNNVTHFDGTSVSNARLVQITQPNGAISKQYSYRTPNAWTDGLVFADETIVTNNAVPATISSSLVSWQQGDYHSPRPGWAKIFDENGKTVKTEYDYTGGLFNQVTRSCDFDDGNVKLRCATSTYENSQNYKGTWNSVTNGNTVEWYYAGGRHIFNLVLATTVENPDGTVASRTNYEYDNYTNQPLTDTPSVIQHNASNNPYTTETTTVQGSCIQWEEHPYGGQYCVAWDEYQVSVFDPNTNYRGNVTKVTNYSDAQNSVGAIANTNGYDITGNLVKASTSCCQQTSIEYNASNFYAYPVSQTRGSADTNNLAERITTTSIYNYETGLLKSGTDANNRTSTLMYNPETLRPVKSISSTGAYTITSYDDTAMTVSEEVYALENGSPVLAGQNKKFVNGIGKVKREEALGANGTWDFVETKYNKLGETWKQSRPFRGNEPLVYSENIFDSQGRTKEIIEPDGSTSKAFFNETARPDSASNAVGNTTRVVDAWGRERWGRYDQQGRLAEVVEPNPIGG